MSVIGVVARKETIQVLRTRSALLSALVFIFIFGGMSAPALLTGGESPAAMLDWTIIYLVLVLGAFTGYIFSGQAFLREKQEGVIETLICSPLSLRSLWFGKVLGVSLMAYIFSLGAAALITVVANAISDVTVLPSVQVMIFLFTALPLLIAGAVGLLGFIQLLLGMRENSLIGFAVIFGIILLLSFARGLSGGGGASYGLIAFLLAGGLVLLGISAYATRFLNRERIVRTIP